jgi:thiol-disulfide isomerase/thioredoxin
MRKVIPPPTREGAALHHLRPGEQLMHLLRGCCWLALIAVLLLLGNGHSPAQEKNTDQAIQVKLVNYEQMSDVIRQLQGKVVVVDFWSTTCNPCRREFPHLVELNAKYAAKGFAAVSVSLDTEPEDAKTQAAVLKFLREKKAAFTNLLLTDPVEVWSKKLGSSEMPIVFVFNRAGQWVRRYTDDVDYANIETLVVELLKEQ